MDTILITGGSQRIGLHLALGFRRLGYPVCITWRTDKPQLQTLRDAGVTCVRAEFDSAAGIIAAEQRIREVCPSLRAIIHNASSWERESGTDADLNLFERLFRVHMQAPYYLNKALTDLLMKTEGLRDIVHITDHVVSKGSTKHLAYCATKAGLDNLTRSFAAKLAPDVKVNAIAPALIMFKPEDSADYQRKALSKSALGIAPGPEVMMEAVHYLLNSPYTTGITLPLEGGRSLL